MSSVETKGMFWVASVWSGRGDLWEAVGLDVDLSRHLVLWIWLLWVEVSGTPTPVVERGAVCWLCVYRSTRLDQGPCEVWSRLCGYAVSLKDFSISNKAFLRLAATGCFSSDHGGRRRPPLSTALLPALLFG